MCLAMVGVGIGAQPGIAAGLTPTPVGTIGFSAHAGLYAWGAATLNDGSVIIGDYWNLRVAHYATDGSLIGQIIDNPGFGGSKNQTPYGLAVDPTTGNIYFCDTNLPAMHVYTSTGAFLYSFGTHGTGANQFLYPSFVAVNSAGKIFISDSWNHTVNMYQPNGSGPPTEVGRFGSLGKNDGQFHLPHGIAIDSLDRVWVNDALGYRVEVFDSNGTFITKFGSRGNAPGQFRGDLRGIAIDKSAGIAYVVDAGTGYINEYDTTTFAYLGRFGGLGNSPGKFQDGGRGITVDGNHNLWIGDLGNFRVQVFSPSGTFMFARPSPAAPPALGGFNSPRGVAVDASGNSFVTDTYNERVEKFDAAGNFVKAWGMRGNGPGLFNYPRLISADPRNGDVVIADTDSNTIYKYDNGGTYKWGIQTFNTKEKFITPYGVDIGPDGKIYVADSNGFKVVVLDENGNFLLEFGSKGTGAGQFKFPRGIDVDTDGSIWVADSSNDNVQHFSATGAYLGTLATKGTALGKVVQPFGVESDGHYIYVADTNNNRIEVWNDYLTAPGYTFATSFGTRGSGLGQLNKPQGIALGPNGNLYIAEQNNDRVSVWSL